MQPEIDMKRFRVVQYATGMAGKEAIRAMANHPELELVGCLVFAKDKVGRDAGEIAGIAPLGVVCTDRLEDIVAMDADAVSFMGLWPDLDAICPLLESGKNVVLTCGLLFPKFLGEQVVERLQAACKKGRSALFGGGVSPGYVQCVAPIGLSTLARRIDRITMEELVDVSDYNSPDLMVNMLGMGRSEAAVRTNPHAQFDTMVPTFFNQTFALMADALQLPVERYETRYDYGLSRNGKQVSFGYLPKGTIAAVRVTLIGWAYGREALLVKLNWIADFDVTGDWIARDQLSNAQMWRITLDGDPDMRLTFEQPVKEHAAGAQTTAHGVIATVMNVLHAIPVLDGRVGIQTYNTLPMMAGRYALRAAD